MKKKHNDYCGKESEINDEILKITQNVEKDVTFEKAKEFDQQKMELYEKQGEYYIERYWINQQLRSLSEMLIINAFKNIEINIKTLIKIAYPDVNSKDFYKWDSLVQFFKSKNIELSSLQGYQEILNIKNINNSLKHTGVINDAIKKLMNLKTKQNMIL